MNILFLSLSDYKSINDSNIYMDLMREFVANKHNVYIISTIEKKFNLDTELINEGDSHLLRVKIGNVFNVGLIEKGLSTVLLQYHVLEAIKKYMSKVKFDLIIYSTPPITFSNIIKYIQKRDKASTYLLLKDIFPQNAVDLRMFTKLNPIYFYFRYLEKELYKISDYIGCMSQANVDYIINYNPKLPKDKIEICPNTITVQNYNKVNINVTRKKYDLPQEKIIFIYGGNLGKPQGVHFLIEVLKKNQNLDDRYFVICGNGNEHYKIKDYIDSFNPSNIKLISGLPKKDYDLLLQTCNVGLIFLDNRFTIPNFPSRLLSYMEYSMPVIACTDKVTDIGKTIEEAKMGFSCESTDADKAKTLIDKLASSDSQIKEMGENAHQYLLANFTSENAYRIIMKHFK